jgi:hypothetical protein
LFREHGGIHGADVVLGAGSFTNTLNPGAGSDNFTGIINSVDVACGWVTLNLDSLFFAKYNTSTAIYSGIVLVTGDPGNIALNTRQFVAANANQNVCLTWWFPTAPTKLSFRESTNNGTSFGSILTVMTEGFVVNGDPVAPWRQT